VDTLPAESAGRRAGRQHSALPGRPPGAGPRADRRPQGQHAADRAESDADDAESYAAYSIDLAYSAIEEAEYAVLEAVLARADADEATPAVAT
jgi:hypothetical protein